MNTLNCKGHLLDLSETRVMGILNVTPDSFFDGGKYNLVATAVEKAGQMISDGADIIDVGGMSSRPGAEIVSVKEELGRVVPIISAIVEKYPNQIISIDTVHSKVAEKAIQSGASIVNDISGGDIDPDIYEVCLENRVPYILMHMKGIPKSMQDNPEYGDVILDLINEFKNKVFRLRKRGMTDLVLDPGFGFGKTIDQNFKILRHLSSFKILDCPILVGISRKSMLYKSLEIAPEEALNATTAAHMEALKNGANMLRVHDVKEAVEAIHIHRLINN